MENRGKKVKKILKELGFNIKKLAPVLEKDDVYIYQYLDNEELSWDTIRTIGNHVKYDFKKDFPDMPFEYDPLGDDKNLKTVLEPLPIELEAKKWKDKYYKLLEDVSDLMREKKNEFRIA